MESLLPPLLVALVVAVLLMCAIYWIGRRIDNFGIVDIA